MPVTRRERIATRAEPGPQQRSGSVRVGCPFCKRYPEHHIHIDGPCTRRWGFDSIRSLNEHLKRDHSLEFGCITCKQRFRCKKEKLASVKKDHETECKFRKFRRDDPIWMDAKQEERWLNWSAPKDAKRHDSIEKKCDDIFKSLFPEAEHMHQRLCPRPSYDFLQVSRQALLEHCHLRLSSNNKLNPSEDLRLLQRIERAISVEKRQQHEVEAIQLAVSWLDLDPPHIRDRCLSPGLSGTPPGFRDPFDLDLSPADKNIRDESQSAIKWTNPQGPDSGYFSHETGTVGEKPEPFMGSQYPELDSPPAGFGPADRMREDFGMGLDKPDENQPYIRGGEDLGYRYIGPENDFSSSDSELDMDTTA